jgi:hypothetical protein
MERIMIGGREMLIDAGTMARVRKAVAKNREQAIRIERELKETRLGPCDCHNQFAGWQGSKHTEEHHARPFQKQGNGWEVRSVDEKFNEFMAQNRSEVIASKQTF